MSKFYHVIRDHHGKWVQSPNNGGECCTTQEDTVEALNKLIQERDALQARVKRLEDAGDNMMAWCESDRAIEEWYAAKESKP